MVSMTDATPTPSDLTNGTPRRQIRHARRLDNVAYEIRGPISAEAERLERQGVEILKLNTGNPEIFGFHAPEAAVKSIIDNIGPAQGYSTAKGIPEVREAIVRRYAEIPGFPEFDADDVFLGNGVSDLILMVTTGLLSPGDEILIPMPDYPLWTAATSLAGGTAVHYRCNEDADWNPDLDDLRSKVSDKTRAIVVISPNNPTGAVYSKETLEGIVQIARENDLLLLSDEIYDRILYDDAEHISVATLAPDLFTITFNGLSKAYLAAGLRAGWMVLTGPKDHAKEYIEGLELLAGTRLCSNVPAQFAIPAALETHQDIFDLTAHRGRLLEQRNVAYEGINSIEGLSTVKPMGALYNFTRIDRNVHDIHDDAKLMLDLLRQEHILMVQGTGFSWDEPDHFRMVTLPAKDQLSEAIERLGNFLSHYRQ
ncbi:pyridoxal phosphate-dependent aminotransferase [Corynebacterium meridianum]|uniref:Aminotransferase n=1 Tax=Corynebacterium meridianum TaxID=2765363 RepID=A0A934I0Y0_9CORY|nr:pyridoxal phosphate-dependent aminotransferase [Corynebacterium meridianum]MBI8990222.1 pyridoxal phosphate-dependent aminotransferase [Corynebacterium meridianum]MCK7678422.1 pyridoxal phosphate-dependent aminotransferase [Corynebacterium meridianum]